jgi:Predicted transcriptional regulators
MRIKEKDIEVLIKFGLSKTQAKAYLTLIEHGISPVRTVAGYLEIGRPEAYRALTQLRNDGIVETILGSPVKYRALPVSNAMSILLEYKKNEITDLRVKSSRLIADYQEKSSKKSPDGENEDYQFSLLSEDTVNIHCINAKCTIDCLSSFKSLNQVLFRTKDELFEAIDRGVKIRCIANIADNTVKSAKSKVFYDFSKKSMFNIKYTKDVQHPFIILFDNVEVIMATTNNSDFNREPFFWSSNITLVTIIKSYFETIWMNTQT